MLLVGFIVGLSAGLVLRARPVGTPAHRRLVSVTNERRGHALGAVMCDATWEAAPDAGAWEEAEMPSFDYESVLLDDRDWHDTTAAIESVRQCLRKTKKVLPLLKQIASRDFFSYYAINLITPCMYFPDYLDTCEIDRCEVDPVRDRDVPSKLLDRDLHEYGFTIDGDPNPKLALTLRLSRPPLTPTLTLGPKAHPLRFSPQAGAGRTCRRTSPNTSTCAQPLVATPGTTARACGASSTPRSASPSDSKSRAARGSGKLVC
jgi:hypothetical protein